MKTGKILVAVDGSEMSSRAVAAGADLAAALGAQLALVNVVDPRGAIAVEGGPTANEILQQLREDGNALLVSAAKEAAASPPVHRFLREGSPGHEVCASAREWGADMIVIGTHGRGGIKRLLMGSTAEGVIRHSPCPVVVVPASAFASK